MMHMEFEVGVVIRPATANPASSMVTDQYGHSQFRCRRSLECVAVAAVERLESQISIPHRRHWLQKLFKVVLDDALLDQRVAAAGEEQRQIVRAVDYAKWLVESFPVFGKTREHQAWLAKFNSPCEVVPSHPKSLR